MSNLEMRHPEAAELLRFADGELPGRKARQVRRHLEACWECRAAVAQFEETVADCVRYRKEVLQTHLPAPPQPWPDLTREFDRIDDAEAESRAWWRAAFQVPGFNRWAATAAVAAALVLTLVYELRETPKVEAAGLLRKAVAASVQRPGARRIHIRTRSQELIRMVGMVGVAAQPAPPVPEIEALFRQAHYDWGDPLSARSFQAWRDGLSARRDVVSSSDGAYQIHTTSGTNELQAATLTLRQTDLEPTAGRFEFRNSEWVEMDELPPVEAPVETASVRPPAMAAPQREETVAQAPAASVADELQVVAALHGVGADLGEPVDVALEAGRVRVNGLGIPAARRQQIEAALAPLARVETHFIDPAPAGAATARADAAAVTSNPVPPRFQPRMEELLGGREPYEKFTSGLLDRNESLMARAYALRRLSQEFSASQEGQLGVEERRLLHGLSREHVKALGNEAAEMERALSPILVSMGAAAAPQSPNASPQWQGAAEAVFGDARRVERLLAVLTGAAPADNSAADLPGQLLNSLAQLRADWTRCQQLLDASAQ